MAKQRKPRRPSKATRQVSLHVPPLLLAEVEALANGGSRNAVLVALIEEGLRAGVEHQHASLIEAAIDRAVRQALGRLSDFAFRAALDSDETRRLVQHLVVKEEGFDRARAIRREAHSASWQRLGEPMPAAPDGAAWPAAS